MYSYIITRGTNYWPVCWSGWLQLHNSWSSIIIHVHLNCNVKY